MAQELFPKMGTEIFGRAGNEGLLDKTLIKPLGMSTVGRGDLNFEHSFCHKSQAINSVKSSY